MICYPPMGAKDLISRLSNTGTFCHIFKDHDCVQKIVAKC
jgi:hypothetical protein